jgi:UDP-N-acetylmuramoylalanine--D-glutamate ligase
MSFLSELPSKKILVVGAGVTGSAVVRYLQSIGHNNFIILDERAAEVEGVSVVNKILAPDFDLAIVSPGWKQENPIFTDLRQASVEIIGELDFAWRLRQEIAPEQKWLALTGTNGKTTTVQMVESIFQAAGIHGIACGNVGTTVIEALQTDPIHDVLVIELSSFQIQWSNEARFETVAILNLADDHIDWHGSFESYANAKTCQLIY